MSDKNDKKIENDLEVEAKKSVEKRMDKWDDFLEKNYEKAPSWYAFWDLHLFPYFDGNDYSIEEIDYIKKICEERTRNIKKVSAVSFEKNDFDNFYAYLIRYNIAMVNNLYLNLCMELWANNKGIENFNDRVSKIAKEMGNNYNHNPAIAFRRVRILLDSLDKKKLEKVGGKLEDSTSYDDIIEWYDEYKNKKALEEAKGTFSDTSSEKEIAPRRMTKKERKQARKESKKEETKKEETSKTSDKVKSNTPTKTKAQDPYEDPDFIPISEVGKEKNGKASEKIAENKKKYKNVPELSSDEETDSDDSESETDSEGEKEKEKTQKQVRKVNPAPKVNLKSNRESKKEDLAEAEAPRPQTRMRKTKEQVEKQQQNFQQQIENKMLNDMAAAPEVKKLTKAEEQVRPSEEMHKKLLKKIKQYNESIIFSTSSHDQIMRATKDLENEHLLINLEKRAPEQGEYILMNQRAIERLSSKGFLKGMTRVDPNRDPQVLSYFTEKIGEDSMLLERGVTCLLKRSGSVIFTRVQKGDFILKGYEEHLKIKTIQSRRRAELVEYGTVVKRKEYTEKRKRATISPSLPEIDLKTLVSLGNTIRNVRNNTVVYNTINEILRVASPYKTYGRLLDMESFQKYWNEVGLSDSDRADFVRAMTHSQMISKIKGVVPVPARYVNLHSNMEDKKSKACLELAKTLSDWADMGDFAVKTSADLKKNNQYKRSIKLKFI